MLHSASPFSHFLVLQFLQDFTFNYISFSLLREVYSVISIFSLKKKENNVEKNGDASYSPNFGWRDVFSDRRLVLLEEQFLEKKWSKENKREKK